MSGKPKVYVAGIGMITPVGADAPMTAAFVRCGRGVQRESDYINNAGKSITMAMVPDEALPEFAPELETSEDISVPIGRMLLMASLALQDAMAGYRGNRPTPLILAGPAAYANQEIPFTHAFFDHLITQTQIQIDRPNCRLINAGRTGVHAAIALATKYLNQGLGDYILVGGVDSYQDYDLLLQLDEQGRIKAEDTPDSFVPGEAAAFLLLTHKAELAKPFGRYKLSISEPGVADEPGHLYSTETYTGSGLADAIRLAIQNGNGQAIRTVYSSMNGEHFWAKEYGVAMIRNKEAMDENVKHEHPAECFGDLGAAAGAVLIGIAGLAMAKEGTPHTSLIYCSSDQAQRAAICVSLEM